MIHWTYTALRPCAVVATGFFWDEAVWGMAEGIYRLRFVALTVVTASALILVQSVIQWPEVMAARETGEEVLVYQGAFREAQDRDREAQKELRNDISRLEVRYYELERQQTRNEEFHRRIEGKFDTMVNILWAMASMLILQVIVPLARMMLGREILKARKEDVYSRVDKP